MSGKFSRFWRTPVLRWKSAVGCGSPRRIAIAKDRTFAIADTIFPPDMTQLRSFLGGWNVYPRFIKGFSQTAGPWTDGCGRRLTDMARSFLLTVPGISGAQECSRWTFLPRSSGSEQAFHSQKGPLNLSDPCDSSAAARLWQSNQLGYHRLLV